jgi:hypothetical protein
MALEIIRHLSAGEQEQALNHVRLLGSLSLAAVQTANPEDFCPRDREFWKRLKILSRADPAILNRVALVRVKLSRGIPVLCHEWEELILSLNLKGFYDSGLDLRYVTLHGNVDLRGAVVGGDFDASHSTVLGDCNEQRMLVLGSIIEEGRVVKGLHSIGAQVRLEDHTTPQSVRRPGEEHEIDLSDLEREARLTTSGDRISLNIPVKIDLSRLEPRREPGATAPSRKTYQSDPTTLRSVTPEQLQQWRDALIHAGAETLTEADFISYRPPRLNPPPKPRLGHALRGSATVQRPRYLSEKQQLLPPDPRDLRHPTSPSRSEPERTKWTRTRRGASRGQRPAPSLRTIDLGWEVPEGDE